jgi:alkyl sulfatase BDS1-like metallo-beta-lactamase superfamily hydrolase
MIAQLSPEMLFGALAICIDGPSAWDEHLTIDVHMTDDDGRYRLQLSNGVLTYTSAEQLDTADLTLTGPRAGIPVLVAGNLTAKALSAAGIEMTGDVSVLARLAGVLDAPDPDFAIVTAEAE